MTCEWVTPEGTRKARWPLSLPNKPEPCLRLAAGAALGPLRREGARCAGAFVGSPAGGQPGTQLTPRLSPAAGRMIVLTSLHYQLINVLTFTLVQHVTKISCFEIYFNQ